MAHLTVPQLIKLLVGAFVVVLVVLGIFLFFKDSVIDFFKNLPGAEEEIPGEEIGEEESGEESEEVPAPTFEYGSKTYTVISPTRIERSDGRYYTLEGNTWSYHGPSSEEEGYVTPATEGQESYDLWISRVNDAISALSEELSTEEDEIEEPPRHCEDCARGTCTERECLRISEESSEFNCRYVLRDTFFGENVCEYVNSNQPSRVCSDCWRDQLWSPICTENRCRDISNELEEFGMTGCEFIRARWFTRSQCTTRDN